MGRNDYHVRDDGRFGSGLVSKRELEGVVGEINDAHEAARMAAILAQHAQTLKDKELPMLKGSGFIVIDPSAPRFDGEEIPDFEDAKSHGSNIAYKNGVAIIYAPVLVMRPKRETADSQPSKLLKQLGLPDAPAAAPIAVIEGKKE